MQTAHAASSIGPSFDRDIGYGPVYEHGEALAASSPIRHVERMTAPMLMLQGEADRVCPIDDNWQLFVALRELGRDVQMVLYPDEHHVMMATARPDRRIDRLQRVVDFLASTAPPEYIGVRPRYIQVLTSRAAPIAPERSPSAATCTAGGRVSTKRCGCICCSMRPM